MAIEHWAKMRDIEMRTRVEEQQIEENRRHNIAAEREAHRSNVAQETLKRQELSDKKEIAKQQNEASITASYLGRGYAAEINVPVDTYKAQLSANVELTKNAVNSATNIQTQTIASTAQVTSAQTSAGAVIKAAEINKSAAVETESIYQETQIKTEEINADAIKKSSLWGIAGGFIAGVGASLIKGMYDTASKKAAAKGVGGTVTNAAGLNGTVNSPKGQKHAGTVEPNYSKGFTRAIPPLTLTRDSLGNPIKHGVEYLVSPDGKFISPAGSGGSR